MNYENVVEKHNIIEQKQKNEVTHSLTHRMSHCLQKKKEKKMKRSIPKVFKVWKTRKLQKAFGTKKKKNMFKETQKLMWKNCLY